MTTEAGGLTEEVQTASTSQSGFIVLQYASCFRNFLFMAVLSLTFYPFQCVFTLLSPLISGIVLISV